MATDVSGRVRAVSLRQVLAGSSRGGPFALIDRLSRQSRGRSSGWGWARSGRSWSPIPSTWHTCCAAARRTTRAARRCGRHWGG
ncbi:hypothetical protein ACFQ0B_49940 [Nonomuraea thailandensis]